MGLGKQTGLSQPNDAALCEAAIAAQAQLRMSIANVVDNISRGYLTQCQMPQATFFDQTLTLSCVPPLQCTCGVNDLSWTKLKFCI